MPALSNALDDRLRRVEHALATPRVPGELAEWSSTVAAEFRDVGTALRQIRSTEHASLFDAIEEADGGLMARVEDLRTTDETNLEALGVLAERFESLHAGLEKSELPEARVESAIETLVAEGVLLLFRVRRNEVALATWLVESVDRDRGDGD